MGPIERVGCRFRFFPRNLELHVPLARSLEKLISDVPPGTDDCRLNRMKQTIWIEGLGKHNGSTAGECTLFYLLVKMARNYDHRQRRIRKFDPAQEIETLHSLKTYIGNQATGPREEA